VSRATVCRWESGAIESLNSDKIAKLAAALQISPEYLMGWTEDPDIVFNSNLATALADLDDNELQSVLNYVAFLKSQRKVMVG
jgi:repressor LexA